MVVEKVGCGSGTFNSGNHHPSNASILRGGRGQLKSENSMSKRFGGFSFSYFFYLFKIAKRHEVEPRR